MKNSLKLFICIMGFLQCVFFLSKAQDWPELGRFKEANEKMEAIPGDSKRVVFLGNSIFENWVKIDPEYFTGHYVNRGISGQTTSQMLIRFRADVIDLEPIVVVILAGTNDIAGNKGPSTLKMIMDNLKSMTEIAKCNNVNVLICSVLPAYDYPWRKGKEPNIKIPKLNKMIREYATKAKVTYVDLFSAMVNDQNGMKKELTLDGVHPNAAGYDVMRPVIEKAIKEIR